jgi:hypothetical protein
MAPDDPAVPPSRDLTGMDAELRRELESVIAVNVSFRAIIQSRLLAPDGTAP